MNYFSTFMSLPNNKMKKELSKYENDLEFQNYFNHFLNLCLDQFEWKGLPETCDARMLEMNLLFRGMACLYKDPSEIIWSYGATIGGMLTRYGYPDLGYAYAWNGINQQVRYYWPFMYNENADAVLCLDNKTGYPFINEIIRAAYTIADAKRSVQTAARNSKYSFIMQCSEEQAKSLKNIYNDIQNNEIAVIISKDNDYTSNTSLFNTNIKTGTIAELWEYYTDIYNDFKDLLGIQSNKQSNKRERVVIDEVNADKEFADLNVAYRLEERKKFCERCNEFFGLNMSVEIKNKKEETENKNIIGGEDDENNAIL